MRIKTLAQGNNLSLLMGIDYSIQAVLLLAFACYYWDDTTMNEHVYVLKGSNTSKNDHI